jgi:hypothetical protein
VLSNRAKPKTPELIDGFQVSNQHDFKGTRALLFLLQVLFVTGELIAIFIIMREVKDETVFEAWVNTCIAVTLIYILVLDSVLCLLFSMVFSRVPHFKDGLRQRVFGFMGLALVGNPDIRARIQVAIELQVKK